MIMVVSVMVPMGMAVVMGMRVPMVMMAMVVMLFIVAVIMCVGVAVPVRVGMIFMPFLMYPGSQDPYSVFSAAASASSAHNRFV
jgi:hypothetical protein